MVDQRRQVVGESVYEVSWHREAERQAAAELGLSLYDLMQRAGAAAFARARALWPESRHWLILCGNGNNGGDGYVVARLARDAGLRVTVQGQGEVVPAAQEARRARAAWLEGGGEIQAFGADVADSVDLVVDALLGYGLQSAPRPALAGLIARVNQWSRPVLALDVPSGLLADTGATPGEAVRADHTVTFIALKPGLLTGRARDWVGKLHCDDLGLTGWLARQPPARLRRYDAGQLRGWLPSRRPCAHKGECGRVLLIGGDQGMGGAISLAAQAALRAGSGLVRVLTRKAHVAALLGARPELMVQPLDMATLAAGLRWADVLVVGPGLGQQAWGQRVLPALAEFHKPMLWDADALNWLAQQPDGAVKPMANRLITPHPGEAARLLGCQVAQVEADRLAAVARLVARYGGAVLLKGAGSVAGFEADRGIVDVGNAGMASGGMGDVLSGVIGGLLAQGLALYEALLAGAVAHGAAADWLAARYGLRGMLARDVIGVLYRFVNPNGDFLPDQSEGKADGV